MEEYLAMMYEVGVCSDRLPSRQPAAVLAAARSRTRARRAAAREHAETIQGGRRKIGYEPPGFDPVAEAAPENL